MRISKSRLIAPIKDAFGLFQRFLAEDLELGHLMTKLIGASLAVLIIFMIGMMMRYTTWASVLLLWFAICAALLIRLAVRYVWPMAWQYVSNKAKSWINELREVPLELDHTDKRPFVCQGSCGRLKMYYEECTDIDTKVSGKRICTACGIRTRTMILWRRPEMDTGTDDHIISDEVAKALRENEDTKPRY